MFSRLCKSQMEKKYLRIFVNGSRQTFIVIFQTNHFVIDYPIVDNFFSEMQILFCLKNFCEVDEKSKIDFNGETIVSALVNKNISATIKVEVLKIFCVRKQFIENANLH